MNPRLVAISGSLKGRVFALDEDELFLGRDSGNAVHLNHASVSRKHCAITRAGNEFNIRDLDSYNGTFVNGVPIKEQKLAHADQIGIGDLVVLFLTEETEESPDRNPVELDSQNFVSGSTMQLRREDAVYLHDDKAPRTKAPQSERVARDLEVLLRIGSHVNLLRQADDLQREVLDSVFEVVPAERGAILLGDGEEFSSLYGRDRRQQGKPVTISRTVVDQVMREGVAVLCNDVLTSETLGGAQSLKASRASALMCVPLVVVQQVIGAIYLDTSDNRVRFDEGHLQLMSGIAGVVAIAIENARHAQTLEDENRRLRSTLEIEHQMVGESEAMQRVYALIAKVAPTDSTVLISGESGTGKELAAHAIHSNSVRAGKPFVAINCATLTETLLESELFGHEKGAFTGAIGLKRGKLEIANGGTVFLDEVGELTPAIQAKLLRVLQEREFDRVGGTRPTKVDVRIITATNRDLEEAIKAGTFRQDLYYRLNVVSLEMPSLKSRREDIPLLANYFAAVYGKKCKRRVKGISAEARTLMRGYDWPGNVRELENAIERAVVLGASEFITPEDLPEALCDADDSGTLAAAGYHEAVKQSKRRLILKALEEAGGNYTEAAKLLGVHPNNLHRMIRNLNLKTAIGK